LRNYSNPARSAVCAASPILRQSVPPAGAGRAIAALRKHRGNGVVARLRGVGPILPGAAGYVDRILNGKEPANLPVQAPIKYELVITPTQSVSELRRRSWRGITAAPC
jgi:hypothetical protein